MITTLIHKYFIDQYVTDKITKKICLINNLRAKFTSILFLTIALISTLYDFLIYQKIIDYNIFILHFKTDIILLVFSFIFLIYVFFNQVVELKEIKKHHRLIHGAISVIIISWGAVKSGLTLLSEENQYYIYMLTILIISILFYYPFMISFLQFIYSYVLLWLIHLVFNITFKSAFHDLFYILFFITISFIISRILYYHKVKYLIKESEISKLKKHINKNGKVNPTS
ncbi:MAG: hypothetical protein R6V23_14455 [Bacteroidales bacterium]